MTDPNERFKITVRGPEADQRAALLTRGRYPVRKVLYAVCKVFGIDPDGYVFLYLYYASCSSD